MKISFIGTGLMGFPMAKNLLKNNFKLNIFLEQLVKPNHHHIPYYWKKIN